jgi:hypothetical protein
MSGSVGRFAVWDDTSNHPTHRVRDVPARSDEDEHGHHSHVHIHLDDAILPRSGTPRASRRDNAGDPGEETPVRRNGLAGQGEVPEEEQHGALICRISQSGEDGSWSGRLADDGGPDGQGTPLHIRSAGTGLEIYHALPPDETGDADPGKLGIKRPDGAAALDRRAAFDQHALEQYQTRGDTTFSVAATRGYAAKMAAAFAQKRRG